MKLLVKLFVDNNLSHRLAKALNVLVSDSGHKVVHVSEIMPGSTDDVDWANKLADEGGWAALTDDKSILSNPAEIEIFINRGVTLFVFNKKWQKAAGLWKKMGHAVAAWPHMLEIYESLPNDDKGAVFDIVFGSEVKIVRKPISRSR